MSRPKAKIVMEVGRWRLQRDKNGWIVKNSDNGETYWPASLAAAMTTLYENVVVDNRFSDDTQNDVKALRDAIQTANDAFRELLTPPKIEKIAEIVGEVSR